MIKKRLGLRLFKSLIKIKLYFYASNGFRKSIYTRVETPKDGAKHAIRNKSSSQYQRP